MSANPKKVEHYSYDDWRSVAPTVRRMIGLRWIVEAECEFCDLRMKVSLPLMARVKGPDYVLWGATGACKRAGCPGKARFFALPPTINHWFELRGAGRHDMQWLGPGDHPDCRRVRNVTAGQSFERPRSRR